MISYVLTLYFFFYLLNYAEITARPANWLRSILGPNMSKATTCFLCFSFWLSLIAYIFLNICVLWCFIVPVLGLFLDATYQKLTGQSPPLANKEEAK
jgi:hypothetical protein